MPQIGWKWELLHLRVNFGGLQGLKNWEHFMSDFFLPVNEHCLYVTSSWVSVRLFSVWLVGLQGEVQWMTDRQKERIRSTSCLLGKTNTGGGEETTAAQGGRINSESGWRGMFMCFLCSSNGGSLTPPGQSGWSFIWDHVSRHPCKDKLSSSLPHLPAYKKLQTYIHLIIMLWCMVRFDMKVSSLWKTFFHTVLFW